MPTPTGPSYPDGLLSAGLAFRRECRGRKVHPTTVRVGEICGAHVVVPNDQALDAGLRADLLEQILSAGEPASQRVWITRGGALSPSDNDFAWNAAATNAFGRHGQRLKAFLVITREGWFDLVSDQVGLWKPPTPRD